MPPRDPDDDDDEDEEENDVDEDFEPPVAGPLRYAIVDGMNVRDDRVRDLPPRWNTHRVGAASPVDRVERYLAGPVIAVATNIARADLSVPFSRLGRSRNVGWSVLLPRVHTRPLAWSADPRNTPASACFRQP